MRRPLIALTLAALVAATTPTGADEILLARFEDYVDALRVQAGIPGLAAAIVGRTSIQWEHGFGQQDVEKHIATRPDTPFQVRGLTEMFTAAIVLRCVEEGRLSLEDRVQEFSEDDLGEDITIREVLTHTTDGPNGLVFRHRPERLAWLAPAVRACSNDSYRETLANWLDRYAMVDSVPGADVTRLRPPAPGIPDERSLERYIGVLDRLATPYDVDAKGRATPAQYAASALTPGSGLVSTVRDLAKFDLALRGGMMVREDTLESAWTAPVGRGNRPLEHGVGWFVQFFDGELIAWQFGMEEDASSSVVVTVPARGLTLVMLANGDGLVKPFRLAEGDVTVSPFVRLFLGLFVG